jgi:N-acetylmuramoyl-L-alanine amidase
VFVGGFGYPYWYDYYPYGYGYYDPYAYSDDGQAVAYDNGGASDGSLVAELQQRLARAGYYYGSIDGIMGPSTRRAIRAYERANGLRVDGVIDDQLLSTMGLR